MDMKEDTASRLTERIQSGRIIGGLRPPIIQENSPLVAYFYFTYGEFSLHSSTSRPSSAGEFRCIDDMLDTFCATLQTITNRLVVRVDIEFK